MLCALVAILDLPDTSRFAMLGLCIILPIVIVAFALLSAISLPSTPLCPFTHVSRCPLLHRWSRCSIQDLGLLWVPLVQFQAIVMAVVEPFATAVKPSPKDTFSPSNSPSATAAYSPR